VVECIYCRSIKIFKEAGFDEPEAVRLALKYSSDSCVSRKIKIFKSEHPDWTQDHCVAAAEGYCREHSDES